MESVKVKVNNEAESKEVQGYFEELGFKKVVWGLFTHNSYFIFSNADYYSRDSFINFSECDYKEITLPQLRDMVVLKRNDVGDANAHRHNNSVHYYITSDNEYFFFLDGKWACSNNDISYLKKYVKPIKENELKEFLVNHNDKWTLQLLDSDTEENSYRVAVPSGATFYAEDSNMGVKGDYFFRLRSDDFDDEAIYLNGNWMRARFDVRNMNVLWKRSETESLNDQYAEIEQVRQDTVKVTNNELKHRVGVDATLAERQATYGSFEDVAFVTENVMGVLSKARPNGLSDLPHTHRMALYMIASKMARIVNGDFNSIDGWHDIGGYAKLIENLIGGEDE